MNPRDKLDNLNRKINKLKENTRDNTRIGLIVRDNLQSRLIELNRRISI